MLDFTAIFARIDAAMATAPARNPDYGSDAMLILSDACNDAARALEHTGKAGEAEIYHAACLGFRNRADRARARAPIHALPLRTVTGAPVQEYLRREA